MSVALAGVVGAEDHYARRRGTAAIGEPFIGLLDIDQGQMAGDRRTRRRPDVKREAKRIGHYYVPLSRVLRRIASALEQAARRADQQA